jgi:hypothetical protein
MRKVECDKCGRGISQKLFDEERGWHTMIFNYDYDLSENITGHFCKQCTKQITDFAFSKLHRVTSE